MFSQHAQTDEIVSLTATHSLRELEYRLLRFLLKTPKRLHEKCPHTVGDVVLFEKGLPVDFVVNQVDEIKNRIPLGSVEDAFSRCAELLEGFHSSYSLNLAYFASVQTTMDLTDSMRNGRDLPRANAGRPLSSSNRKSRTPKVQLGNIFKVWTT
jgi:hypothetical protein